MKKIKKSSVDVQYADTDGVETCLRPIESKKIASDAKLLGIYLVGLNWTCRARIWPQIFDAMFRGGVMEKINFEMRTSRHLRPGIETLGLDRVCPRPTAAGDSALERGESEVLYDMKHLFLRGVPGG